jgi:hypothetical protein
MPARAGRRPRPRRGFVVLSREPITANPDGRPRPGGLRARVWRALAPPSQGRRVVAAAPPVPIADIFRRFWPYARPLRRWIALSLVLVAVVPLIETATIWMFKLVVDDVLVPRDFGPFWWIARSPTSA